MKISIPIKSDSDNSYPSSTLEILANKDADIVELKIDDDDRTIQVSLDDLERAIRALS